MTPVSVMRAAATIGDTRMLYIAMAGLAASIAVGLKEYADLKW